MPFVAAAPCLQLDGNWLSGTLPAEYASSQVRRAALRLSCGGTGCIAQGTRGTV